MTVRNVWLDDGKRQRIEELKLEVMARNPAYLGVIKPERTLIRPRRGPIRTMASINRAIMTRAVRR